MSSAGSQARDPAERKYSREASLGQAALRRAAVLRRAGRPAAVLRRALPARLLSVRFTFGRRVALALRFFFTIFAICFSLSFSLSPMSAHFRIATTRCLGMNANH